MSPYDLFLCHKGSLNNTGQAAWMLINYAARGPQESGHMPHFPYNRWNFS